MQSAPNRPLVGIFWMIVTGFCFVMVTALVKVLGGSIPAAQAAFVRYCLGLVFLIPIWRELTSVRLTGRDWGFFGVRGFAHALGVILWFYAMTRIPIAEVTAMNYLNPVYVTILAALFLGERLAARRILAIVAALVGAMLILRPGFRELDLGHIAMIGTAMLFAVSYLLTKMLSGRFTPSVIVGMLSIFVTIGLAPFALMDWVPPTGWDLVVLFGVACFATAGHYTMTMAFAAAPVSVTQPVTFLQLVWSVAIGAVFFSEAIDIWVIAGGSVIVAAISYISWREALLRKRITPGVNAPKT